MNNGTTIRELSSVGSERLPYKQRVGGSTPSAPTKNTAAHPLRCFFVLSHPPAVPDTGSWNAIRRYQISNEKPVQESERASVDSYLRFGEISHLAVQRDTITKHY